MNDSVKDKKKENITSQNDVKSETDDNNSSIPSKAINRDYTYIW